MSSNDPSKADDLLLTRIDEVLHYLWDPIGISDIPEARDEYRSYAGNVFSLIKRGSDEDEIAALLRKIRIERMGVAHLSGRATEVEVAEILMNWKETILGQSHAL